MRMTEFTRILKNEYKLNNEKILELAKIGKQCAEDAHEGLNLDAGFLAYIGRDFILSEIQDGAFDVDTMKFV